MARGPKQQSASGSLGRASTVEVGEKARHGDQPRKRRPKLVQQKRAIIMAAALEIFSRYGLHGTSLDQVATLAGVSKTNLLYYFSTKEELYISLMQQLLDIWLSPLKAFSVEQDPITTLKDYIRIKLELARDRPAESRLFCLEVIQGAPLILDQLKVSLRELVTEKSTVIGEWIAQGKLAPVDPVHLIFTIWATTQHYADFRTQVEAVTGRTLCDPEFFDAVLVNLDRLILSALDPRRAVAAEK